jgi:hypothetical protein
VDEDHDEEFAVPAATVLGGIRLPLWSRLPRPHRNCNEDEAVDDEVVSFLAAALAIPVPG